MLFVVLLLCVVCVALRLLLFFVVVASEFVALYIVCFVVGGVVADYC